MGISYRHPGEQQGACYRTLVSCHQRQLGLLWNLGQPSIRRRMLSAVLEQKHFLEDKHTHHCQGIAMRVPVV